MINWLNTFWFINQCPFLIFQSLYEPPSNDWWRDMFFYWMIGMSPFLYLAEGTNGEDEPIGNRFLWLNDNRPPVDRSRWLVIGSTVAIHSTAVLALIFLDAFSVIVNCHSDFIVGCTKFHTCSAVTPCLVISSAFSFPVIHLELMTY